MSPTVSRLLLSLAVVIALPFVYMDVFLLLGELNLLGMISALLCATASSGALLVLALFLIWRRAVRWTKRRIIATLWVSLATVLTAVLVAALNIVALPWHGPEFGILLGGLCWAALWVGGMAKVWCTTDRERAERASLPGGRELRCPKCGYNMHGLHEARCPECGSHYTLDGLLDATIEQRSPLESD